MSLKEISEELRKFIFEGEEGVDASLAPITVNGLSQNLLQKGSKNTLKSGRFISELSVSLFEARPECQLFFIRKFGSDKPDFIRYNRNGELGTVGACFEVLKDNFRIVAPTDAKIIYKRIIEKYGETSVGITENQYEKALELMVRRLAEEPVILIEKRIAEQNEKIANCKIEIVAAEKEKEILQGKIDWIKSLS